MIIDICVMVNGKIDFCTKAKNHKATLAAKEEMEEEISRGQTRLMCEFCGQTLEREE